MLICAYEDYKLGEIHYRWLIMMVDFRFLLAYPFLLMSVLFYRYIEKFIGGADIIIFILLYSRYGLLTVSKILLIASMLALIYSYVKRKKEIRFIPFILLGYILEKII